MFDFSGKVVLVTGASGNLGSAVAFAFRNAGAKMALVGRSAERLNRSFVDLVGSPDCLLISDVDLTNEYDTKQITRLAYDHFGHIDTQFRHL